MTPRELEEYRALRDTVRERGTLRHIVVVAGLAMWALLAAGVTAFINLPVATLVPLLLLASVFEVTFTLHTAVERVGRYLQVFFEQEPDDMRRWEHVAMAYGQRFGGGGIDPLFSPLFLTATLFNLLPALVSGPLAIDWGIVALVHALFALRIVAARRQAARQRAVDLARFRQLRDAPSHA